MVRSSAAILLIAVLALTSTSLLWLLWLEDTPPTRAAATPQAVLGELAEKHPTERVVDLGARYTGRLELLEPRQILPTWHTHPRAEAAAVFAATRQCPPLPLPAPVGDPSLAKAYRWHAHTCAPGAQIPEEELDRPPFMHPSGKSYAALATVRGNTSAAFLLAHARSFHVLELSALAPSALDPTSRVLQSLSPYEWTAIARGDRLVLSPSSLIIVEQDALGLQRLRLYDARAWEALARASSLALVPRTSSPCWSPASSSLCWQPISALDRHRNALVIATTSSAVLVVIAAMILAVAYVRERRRMHADRIHVLRTLTHELRTPATSLGFDVEPLRAAYDDLPASCQEPLLRISDGVARLNRVLHRSARYMALFETSSSAANAIVTPAPVASTSALMLELSEEWPDGVDLRTESEDGAVTTDPEWLGVAVRNLVENAFRHGEQPVTVTWKLDSDSLIIRVGDAGASGGFSLRRAVTPYQRDPKSPGLGLGLAIVDRVTRLLDGKLLHEPSPTVFELRLPRHSSSGARS